MKNIMCLWWLDTIQWKRKRKAIQVYCNVTLLIRTPKNYIMPTNLAQNYKVILSFSKM